MPIQPPGCKGCLGTFCKGCVGTGHSFGLRGALRRLRKLWSSSNCHPDRSGVAGFPAIPRSGGTCFSWQPA